jgi:hypothetical protein
LSESTIEIFQYAAYRTGEARPVACLSQSLAQFKLNAFAGTASVANVAGVSSRESMSVSQVRKSDFRKSLRNLPLQRFIQTPQQHIGSRRGISVHGNDGVAARDQIKGTRLVETMTGKVQAVEIVARRSQPLKKVKPVLIAGDQTRDLGSAPLNPPAVLCENGDPGWIARHDVHGVVDAFCVAPREIVVRANVVDRFPLNSTASPVAPEHTLEK